MPLILYQQMWQNLYQKISRNFMHVVISDHINNDQNKNYWHINKIKLENNPLKKVVIESRMCYYFNAMTKSDDFSSNNY